MAGLRTPLSRIIEVLKARTEGQGLNATARTFGVSKKSIIDWERRLSELKPTLTLYGLCHQFLNLVIAGDELYRANAHVSSCYRCRRSPKPDDGKLPPNLKLLHCRLSRLKVVAKKLITVGSGEPRWSSPVINITTVECFAKYSQPQRCGIG